MLHYNIDAGRQDGVVPALETEAQQLYCRMNGYAEPSRPSAVNVIALLSAALLLTLMGHRPLSAHPHLWIGFSVEVVAEDDAIKELRLSWLFDPMFSSVLIGDHDADRSGSFSAAEVKALQEGAFSNLREFDYFVYLRQDGVQAKPKDAENFSASIENGRVRYRFSLPLPSRPKAIEVSHFDETYFVALQPDREKPFTVAADRGAAPTCAAGEGKMVQGLISSFSPAAVICSFAAAR